MMHFDKIAQKNVESSTGLLFMQTYNKWHHEIKNELKKYDITHPQFVVISSIGYLMQIQIEITQVMISNVSGMDVMSISQILKLLEKKGLIERKPHSSDTRANAINLSESGIEKLEQTLPVVESVDKKFFSPLEEKESEFINLLKKLNI